MKKNIKLDIIELLDEIMKGKYSNIQMNYYFSKKNYLQKEKEFITNVINITIKNLIFIDYVIANVTRNIQKRKIRQLLRISAAQILFMNSDNDGVIYEAVETAKEINRHQSAFVNASLQAIIKKKEKIIADIPEDRREGILYSYPQWIVNKLKADYPQNYIKIMESYKKRSYLSVRYNKKKIIEVEFEKILSEVKSDVIFKTGEIYYLSNGNIFKSEAFKKGDIVIQDASSYFAAKNLGVLKGDVVLDACSAPGGKTLAILQETEPKIVVASDIHPHKIKILEDMKKKYNLENLHIYLNDASRTENLNMQFNKILADVPCSGLGVLRKKPEKIYNLTPENIKHLKKLQKNIFESCYNSLKSEGVILYSTCTFIKNENTNNLEYFLNKFPDLTVEKIYLPENIKREEDPFGGVYITSENEFLDGLYMAKLRKK